LRAKYETWLKFVEKRNTGNKGLEIAFGGGREMHKPKKARLQTLV
jgi:hypothetical protein